MRITRLHEIEQINELREKLERVFNENFTDEEVAILADISENADELFWDIMLETIQKHVSDI